MTTWIWYEFKPIDRCMTTAVHVWRTALDNIGLQHKELPEITPTLVDWGVMLNEVELEGKADKLEEQLILQVQQQELRYLNISVYEGVNPDGTMCFQYQTTY
jgi:hypothetical protein